MLLCVCLFDACTRHAIHKPKCLILGFQGLSFQDLENTDLVIQSLASYGFQVQLPTDPI